MITECIDAGWIIFTQQEEKNKKTYFAADSLIRAYENYGKWLYSQLDQTGIRNVSLSIKELKRMIEHAEC
jgi:hypothetical protein